MMVYEPENYDSDEALDRSSCPLEEEDGVETSSAAVRRSGENLLSPNQKKTRLNRESVHSENVNLTPGDNIIIAIVKSAHELFRSDNAEAGRLLSDILSVDDLEYGKDKWRAVVQEDAQPNGTSSSRRSEEDMDGFSQLVELLIEEGSDADRINRLKKKGDGVIYDTREILDQLALLVWLKMAEDFKDPNSMVRAGLSYYRGKGTDPNIHEALRLWKNAADLGDNTASVLLARYYQSQVLEGGSYDGKLYTSKEKSREDKNNEESQYSSDYDDASIPSEGSTEENSNLKDFLRYTIITASQDDARSLRTLGLIYQDGLFGVRPSPKRALKMYLKAAEKNELFSMFKAAEIYYHGATNVPRDRKAALQILAKAAEAAPIPNWELLGNLYRFGVGAPDDKPDLLNSVKCYKNAIEAGSVSALKAMADLCWSIFVKDKDRPAKDVDMTDLTIENTFEYYERAAALGEVGAMLGLARCYWRGIGVEKSEERCKSILEQLVEKLEDNSHKVISGTGHEQDVMSLIIETGILDE